MPIHQIEATGTDLELESIKNAIEASLREPEEEQAVINGLFQEGEYEPSHQFFIADVTVERAEIFFRLLSEVLKKNKDIVLSPTFNLVGLLEHEFAHIKKARELGIDPNSSSLTGYFTTSEKGLDVLINFDFTSSPLQKAQVALAPENPSTTDLACGTHYTY